MADKNSLNKPDRGASEWDKDLNENFEIIEGSLVPSGLIAMWSGSSDNIPSGWALCDGNNGTPDLRDRFIVGAKGDYSIGDKGGSKETSSDGEHSHDISVSVDGHTLSESEMPSHSHNITLDVNANTNGHDAAAANEGKYGETNTHSTGGDHSHSHGASGSSEDAGEHTHEIMPPYYALAFIMKL